jgi:long-chain fatty acid transport protein
LKKVMMIDKTFVGFFVSLFVILLPTSLFAGGLFLPEARVVTNGTATAGEEAMARDASTVTMNPAGMSRLTGKSFNLYGGLLDGDIDFDSEAASVSGGDGGNQAALAPIMGFDYAHKINDQWSAGLSLISLAGASVDPSDDWVGRYQVTEVTMLSLSLAPAIAYRFNDKFSVGATAIITYLDMDYDLAVGTPGPDGKVNIEGDDISAGVIIGALYEFSEATRLGVSFMSQIDLELGSDVSTDPLGIDVRADLEMPLPATLRGALVHDVNEKWTIMGSLGWEQWSDYDEQAVSGPNASRNIVRNWDDTWRVALGAQYHYSDKLMLQAGFAYDSSPVDDEDRTADMAVDEQIRLAAGFEYQINPNMTIGSNLTYIDLGDARIEDADFTGSYDSNWLVVFGVYSKWQL